MSNYDTARRETLLQLKELKTAWRRQDFRFTSSQQQQYNELLKLRRTHVQEYYKEGNVWVGPSLAGKALDEGKTKND